MNELKHIEQHYTDNDKWPGSLKTAEELEKDLGISAQRLNELAYGKFAPHFRIDGGVPLFQKGEIQKWLAKNLLERVDGQKLPIEMKILIDAPRAINPPIRIAGIKGLRQIPIAETPSGIYFLCRGEEIVYVGQSVRPMARIGSHTDKSFDRAYLLPVPAEFLNDVEGTLIKLLTPQLNGGKNNTNGNYSAPVVKNNQDDILNEFCQGIK